jgi:hypothetical protein
MKFVKKIKSFVVEYWEIFVAGILVAIGFILGTSGSRESVLKKDKLAQKKASEEIEKGTDEAIQKFKDSQKKNESIKSEKEDLANQEQEDRKKELLKDSKKLDKILEDKYKLKKG